VPATIEGTDILTPLGGFSNPRSDLDDSSGIAAVLRPEDVEAGQEGVPARVAEILFSGGRYLVWALTDSGPIWTYTATRPVLGERLVVRARRGWPVPSSHGAVKESETSGSAPSPATKVGGHGRNNSNRHS